MTVLVTDTGFVPDDWRHGFVPHFALSDQPDTERPVGADVTSSDLSGREWQRLVYLSPHVALIRICLRHFGDTQAITLVRRLRAAGFTGRARAHGAVLARCYTFARWAGFDEVELDRAQALRQPCEHWRNDPSWQPVPHLLRRHEAFIRPSAD